MTALADISVINTSGAPTSALAIVMWEGDERPAPRCPFGPSVAEWGPIAVAYYEALVMAGEQGNLALLDRAVDDVVDACNAQANSIIERLHTSENGRALIEQRLDLLGS